MVNEIRMDRLDAVIFDLDGVITDTASVHAAAWTRMFDRFLADRADREGEDHNRSRQTTTTCTSTESLATTESSRFSPLVGSPSRAGSQAISRCGDGMRVGQSQG
jgi:phosphoglycolate phosphatase-like HAD superfamily hydrolase